ncbi:MAG: 4-alpha-glucanotransferase [Acidobacteriia bacterium]|nr:4-alpha-glucanotransferase [Terriglobia bacterium]
MIAAILASLGVNASTRDSLDRDLEERKLREWRSPLPATLVLNGTPQEIPVSIPAELADSAAVLEIRMEDGGVSRLELDLGGVAIAEEASIDGRRYVRKRIRLPRELELGYHQLAITIGERAHPPVRLIVCPSRVYQPPWLDAGRAAGVAITLYGLRSGRNWGCGDTTDLKALIDWVGGPTGASFVALNPLHAIFNRQPFNTSPYLPNSVFYRNPIYLDVEQIEDFRSSPRAQSLVASPAIQAEIQALRATEFVEYERVQRLKTRFLKLLFRSFLAEWRENSERARELGRYIQREGDLLHRFAVHSALDEALHRQCPEVWTWPQWPEQYQDPESAATAEFAQKHWRSVLFHKYLQWQLDLQLSSAQQHARRRGLSIGLYHDLALATDRFGSDLWAHREFFANGCRVGAPPDSFSPKGQDWAFPPPDSERHYQDGYRLFSESIRKNCQHGGALRIDHVMRFFRLYWIPDGVDATEGTYVRDRFRDLLGILALESVRQKVLVVGEDLGTVPDKVREVLRGFGILSYRLLYFEHDGDGRFRAPGEYPRDALASVTTHDLPTLAGFWLGRDIEARRSAGLLPEHATYRRMLEERARDKQKMLDVLIQLKLLPDWFPRSAEAVPELTGELHNAIVGFLSSTPSKLMVLNQEDLLKETEQQNLPGTTFEYPNWRRKMRCTLEELWTSGEVQAFASMFRSWLARTDRLNSAT